jgi:RNA polymerase sigma-54 factor
MARLKQYTGLKHRTSISVHLKNSLKILTLNTVELSQDLQTILNENIFLEETRPAELSLDDIALQQHTSNQSSSTDSFENYSTREKTLQEHLTDQLSVSSLSGSTKQLASLFISSLDNDGFLHDDHESIALKNGFTRKDLSHVLDFLTQLDPLGVCSRDIWQSLEWQAASKYPRDTVLPDVLAVLQQGNAQLTELNQSTISDLVDYLHIPLEKITHAIARLKTLNINPAGNFRYQERTYIIPEVIYTIKDNAIQVSFSSPLLPEITINDDLMKSLQKDKNIKQWKEMYNDAKNVVKSIDYRKNSILKIAKIIGARQKMFFLKGQKHLKPMILKDLADITKLNVSTISRILKNKYCMTPYGVFPLSFFLLKKAKSSDGEDLSVEDLKKSIAFIIDNENKITPLSDSSIMIKLSEFGFNVKRRTVAKYRKLLHIPSAKKRVVIY